MYSGAKVSLGCWENDGLWEGNVPESKSIVYLSECGKAYKKYIKIYSSSHLSSIESYIFLAIYLSTCEVNEWKRFFPLKKKKTILRIISSRGAKNKLDFLEYLLAKSNMLSTKLH